MPVRASFDGVPYLVSLVKMGGENHLILIRKKIREQLGERDGECVTVVIELDDSPRVVKAPADLSAALAANNEAERRWPELAYSHRREYVRWIEEAKREETRRLRSGKCVEMVGQGLKPAW